MANKGYLQDMRCPECKSYGPFSINCYVTATIHDDKIGEVYDLEWDNDNTCVCASCNHTADAHDFYTYNQDDED